MILLHIAIRGDNKEHARESLLRAIQELEHGPTDPLAREHVHAAWMEPVELNQVNRTLQTLPEILEVFK